MPERTEHDVRAEIAAAQAEYHDRAEALTPPQARAFNDRLRTLRGELDALLGAGARACPACGQQPHARLKRAAYEDKDGEHSAVYQVACPGGHGDARASTPEKAVERWNALDVAPTAPGE